MLVTNRVPPAPSLAFDPEEPSGAEQPEVKGRQGLGQRLVVGQVTNAARVGSPGRWNMSAISIILSCGRSPTSALHA